jgi:hypothetical protein
MDKRLSKILATVLVTAIMLGAFPIIMPAVRALPALPAFWVVPDVSFNTGTTSVGKLFNVTLYAGTASDVYAHNWGVLFDPSQLACITGGYTGDGKSQWFTPHSTSTSGPYIDNTAGEVLGGETLMGSDVVHASSGSVAWLEFQIIAAPGPGDTLSSTIDPNSPDSYFLDTNLHHMLGVSYQAANYSYVSSTPPPSSLSVSIGASSTTIYLGQSVHFASTVNGGYPPYAFQWFLNGSSVSMATLSTWIFTPTTSDTYTVYLNATDSHGTTAKSNVITVIVLPPLTGARIDVDPSEILDLSMGPSSTFYVNVTVANVPELATCQFNLTYDPEVLDWIGFDLYRVQGEYPIINIGGEGPGFVYMSLYYQIPVSAVSSVAVITVHFHVGSYGISPLNLTDTLLLDSVGYPVTHNEFDGIFISIIRDVAVVDVVPDVNWVYQGWTDNINVTVANLGNVSETFDVSAWYDTTLIGTSTVTGLPPNTQTTKTFAWNTSGVPEGNYTITGKASLVPYENYFNTANNVFIDGVVEVVSVIHDVAITDVVPSVTWAYAGWSVGVQVTATNLGNVSEDFDVTAYYDSNAIDTQHVLGLASNDSTVLTFDWDTTGLAEGFYTMSAQASLVPHEFNVSNNIFVDGQVQILTMIRDVAIINVTTSRAWIYQGMPVNITVTAKNVGEVVESFNVFAYCDTTLLGGVPVVDLAPGAEVDEVFTLNTTALIPCNIYTISGQASFVPFELNITNNIFVDGGVKIRLVGDINDDGKVDITDVATASKAFGSSLAHPGNPPRWNPDADITGIDYLVPDGKVDIQDIALISQNFGKHC